jgi:hypothetical protein
MAAQAANKSNADVEYRENTMNNEYKPKIEALMRKHKLGFLHNPGGGEFTHRHKTLRVPCQVPNMGDYKEDYDALMRHLIAAGMEAPNDRISDPAHKTP